MMGLRGENVLITGGAGFIGSALIRRLLQKRNQVTVLDNFLTGSMGNLRDVVPADEVSDVANLELVSGDLLRMDLETLLVENDIDYVFHLAAEPFVPNCYDRPRDFFTVNANGTLRLLLACANADVTRVLHYSSSEVYGTARHVPMDESHPTSPQSTYAVSKLASDRLSFTLHHEQDVPVVILRQFNCYGPRETHPYIVPELIAQLDESRHLTLGNIDASRDLTYVDDAVRGADKLIDTPEAEGEVVNLGYGEDFTVEELARKVGNLMGYSQVNIVSEKSRLRPLDVERLQCDHSKAQELIDYQPTVSLTDGLERTIRWYRERGPWVWEESPVTRKPWGDA